MQEIKMIYKLNQRIALLELEKTRDYDTKCQEIRNLEKQVKRLEKNIDLRYEQENGVK